MKLKGGESSFLKAMYKLETLWEYSVAVISDNGNYVLAGREADVCVRRLYFLALWG